MKFYKPLKKDIQKLIGKTIPVMEDQPYHMRAAAYIQSLPPKKKSADAKKTNAGGGQKRSSGGHRRFTKRS